MLKRTKIILLTSAMCLLTSCSINLDEVEWDSVIDDMLEVAVGYLLESDGTSPGTTGTAGNIPPVPESRNTEITTAFYYNEANPHSEFLFQGMSKRSLTNTYTLSGTVQRPKVMNAEDYAQCFTLSSDSSFPLTFYEFSPVGIKKEETMACFVVNTEPLTIEFTTEDGEFFQYTVDDWGYYYDPDGERLLEPLNYVHLEVSNVVQLHPSDGSVCTTPMDLPDSYLATVVVADGVVTSISW